MTKLIFFFNAHLKIGISGGDERALQILKRWISKKKTHISIYTDPFIRDEIINRDINVSHVYTIYYKELLGSIIEYLLRIRKTISILKKQDIDKCICYSVSSFLPDVFPSMWCKKHGNNVRWYGLIHHIIPDFWNRPGNKIWNFIAWLEQKFCLNCLKRYADGILVVNSDIRNYLLKCGVDEKKIVVVANGFDDEEISSIVTSGKEYDGVYVGRLLEEKGFYDLPDIWNKVCHTIPDAKLCIVGNGDEDDINLVKNRFSKYNILQNVEFAGSLTHYEVIRMMKKSKMLVFPSYSESWGMVITEAMACGLPCVTYDIPVFKNIYYDINQVANLHDIDGLSQIIIDILNDADNAQRLGDEGKKLVFYNYTWERIADNEWNILNESHICY